MTIAGEPKAVAYAVLHYNASNAFVVFTVDCPSNAFPVASSRCHIERNAATEARMSTGLRAFMLNKTLRVASRIARNNHLPGKPGGGNPRPPGGG